MKLYTEEQVIRAIHLAHGNRMIDEVIADLTPIELPSDEEIYDKIVFHDGSDYYLGEQIGFINGAKYVIEKLQGGNK